MMMSFEQIAKYLSELNLASIFLRLFLAVVFSGIIGFEREKRRRAAGFRTHMLVCLGATLAMLTDQYIYVAIGGSTPTRIAAQVVSGIGFLGAGTILVTGRQQVKGLTTAAGLWASACMGIALGSGFYSGAIAGFIFILLVVVILHKVDNVVDKNATEFDLYMEIDNMASLKGFSNFCRSRGVKFSIQKVGSLDDDGSLSALVTLDVSKCPDSRSVVAEIGALSGISSAEKLS